MISTVSVSHKVAKILTVSCKSHNPIETLFHWNCFVSNKKNIKKWIKDPFFFQPAPLLENTLMLLVVTFPASIFPTTMKLTGHVPGISRCSVGKSSNWPSWTSPWWQMKRVTVLERQQIVPESLSQTLLHMMEILMTLRSVVKRFPVLCTPREIQFKWDLSLATAF